MIRTEINVGRNPWRGDFEFYVVHDKKALGLPLTLKEMEPGSMMEQPTMSLSPEEVQYLADQLWQAGVRPVQSKQSHGAFEAQGKHLEDMRTLVFKVQPGQEASK